MRECWKQCLEGEFCVRFTSQGDLVHRLAVNKFERGSLSNLALLPLPNPSQHSSVKSERSLHFTRRPVVLSVSSHHKHHPQKLDLSPSSHNFILLTALSPFWVSWHFVSTMASRQFLPFQRKWNDDQIRFVIANQHVDAKRPADMHNARFPSLEQMDARQARSNVVRWRNHPRFK